MAVRLLGEDLTLAQKGAMLPSMTYLLRHCVLVAWLCGFGLFWGCGNAREKPITSGTTGLSTASGSGGSGSSVGSGGAGGDLCVAGSGGGKLRVASWNMAAVGEPGTAQYDAALAVLRRIDADVVGVNEVNGSNDAGYFDSLAVAAGYDYQFVSDEVSPFGTQRNGFLSKIEPEKITFHSAATLSGDEGANDLTRLLPELRIRVNGCPVWLVVHHWKSGYGKGNVFRRAVESYRIGQILKARDGAKDPFVVMGDVNEELDALPKTPVPFFDVPDGMPPDFAVGGDINMLLASSEGIDNNAFSFLLGEPPGLNTIDALQLDGSDATKSDSGRRLDYIFASSVVAEKNPQAEVYDSEDEAIAGGLGKFGSMPDTNASLLASDHFLVFSDIDLPACTCERP